MIIISQNKFAKEIGVSSYYVGQLIKGEKRPPSRELQTKILMNQKKSSFLT